MSVNTVETMQWIGDSLRGHLNMIDQTLLPTEMKRIDCKNVQSVWDAIKRLSVRGAPAIGIAAAYGVVIGLQDVVEDSKANYLKRLETTADHLAKSRPTAVNLFWALDRMRDAAKSADDSFSNRQLHDFLLDEAKSIHEDDRTMCHAIGKFGAELISDGSGVLTHCNAGGLATAEYGTALSVFFTAQDLGKNIHVFVDETRPLLQGSRLTAWELQQRGIQATLICDSMAAQVMREGKVQSAITGADRIAANGDTANKIGTYSVALLAKMHNLPFYVAAPTNTFDLSIESGKEIPIEQRNASEITHGFNHQTAPEGVDVYNPAFDVTPAEYIEAIITEKGLIKPVNKENIAKVVNA